MKTLFPRLVLGAMVLALAGGTATAQDAAGTPIRMPLDPSIGPDGKTAVFSWLGDLWLVDIPASAPARRLTLHPASDGLPLLSPDGGSVLFVSDRNGGSQVFVMDLDGGQPRQVTFDSDSKRPLHWTADGEGFLAVRTSDRSPFATEARRLVEIRVDRDRPERVLFNGGANTGTLSADGKHALFLRGRIQEERKGYRGPAAEQIWHADLSGAAPKLTRHSKDLADFQNISERHPMWMPSGEGYWFVSDPDGTFDVYRRDIASGIVSRVTNLREMDGRDDGVMSPSLSADGKKMLFLRGFDLHVLDTGTGKIMQLAPYADGDFTASWLERRALSDASAVAFTDDGKQIAFVAGHDVYVMDRILREPKRVTNTPAVESSLCFADDGKRLFFTSEESGEVEIWEATAAQEDGIWWMAESFGLRKITDDRAVEGGLKPSPTGEHIAFVKGADLWVMDSDGSDHRRIFQSWDAPRVDWSPDGKWMCWSVQDGQFNDEVWIAPLDGTREPFNLSRHPDDDQGPVWSPSGNHIAWVGRRQADERDIYYVTLNQGTAEETSRDRKLREAMAAMQGKGKKKEDGDESEEDSMQIDFEGIHDRIARISIPDSFEGGLIWSADGKSLYFSASPGGQRGIHKVTFPDKLSPSRVASSAPSSARWLKQGNQVVGLSSGKPATMNPNSGKIETFSFSVRETRDWHAMRGLAFDQGWRAMRDRFYDGAMNNKDWEAIRRRYRPVAMELLDSRAFSVLMNRMLGELNASHMGHRGGSDPLPSFDRPDWTESTFHLGLRFVDGDEGPGKLVESVIPGGPTSLARSEVKVGERVILVDGAEVGSDVDLYPLLTMPEARDVVLTIRADSGEERNVSVRPTRSVRGLLYDEWVENTRRSVEELSGGRIGYLHIRGMNQSSFYQLEEDMYAAGHGKEALIIDVRFNGGGSTADLVLTALTQPKHAITVPRGGPIGYPQDRKVFASWDKPIALMCNEMSFSNAEILSHAVKTLGRGPVIGMRTAGGVISTGGQGLVDGSFVRMPFRGWYVSADGKDMELNGCLPHHALWNDPLGGDQQLEKAVEAVLQEVSNAAAQPAPVDAAELRK